MLTRLRLAVRHVLGREPEMMVPPEPRHDWHIYAYGGGMDVKLLQKTRDEALQQAVDFGTVSYVDDDRHFVFVKPASFTPTLPTQAGF